MATERAKGAKSAPRTELVTVRFDPETKYLMDLAARAQHRSLANFVEWAVEESFRSVAVYANRETGDTTTVADVRGQLWDPIEPDRLCILGSMFPHLLSHDEQKVWKLICEIQYIDPLASDVGGQQKGFGFPVEQLERVRTHWGLLKNAAEAGVLASSVVEAIKGDRRVRMGIDVMGNITREMEQLQAEKNLDQVDSEVKPAPKKRK